jgi:small subunit ribosomal protein S5
MYRSNKEVVSLVEKLICVNKVSKTTTGGRRLAFAALVVVGDCKGRVGFGTGKAKEVTDARNKALENAKRFMIRVPLKEGRTIHHDCEGKFGRGHVIMRPAVAGTGIISGGPMRAIFECLGVQDVVSKSLGTNNPYGMILATFEALRNMNSPKSVADRRSKHISEIVKRRNMIANGGGYDVENSSENASLDDENVMGNTATVEVENGEEQIIIQASVDTGHFESFPENSDQMEMEDTREEDTREEDILEEVSPSDYVDDVKDDETDIEIDVAADNHENRKE